MTDATPTRAELAQRFRDLVVPAAERAGYAGHGAKARFARDTGMVESSVTRLWQGTAVPDGRFYDAISVVTGIDLGTLLVAGGVLTPKILQSLSETDRSQVGSALTLEEAADQLGIHDPVSREMFYAGVERLQRHEADTPNEADDQGRTAAQM